jgi:hypothetical protein
MMQEDNDNLLGDDRASPPAGDEFDALLRQWHEVHAERARDGRDRLLRTLAGAEVHAGGFRRRTGPLAFVRRVVTSPYARAAASFLLLVALIALLMPLSTAPVHADEILVPDGGRLEAFDEQGNAIGPCALQHTDVDVAVSGRFTRVTLTQHFHNPYAEKIEAVYTFPLSHRAAVDRMKMIVGDRVVIGEVKERQEARRIYEAARASGYVASLLEQERPNIFTQSIANIEPGADVRIEISYVEILQVENGLYRFDFPMTVAPRYIPGSPTVSRAFVPAELEPRHGIILRGRAQLTLGQPDNTETLGTLQIGKLDAMLHAAQPTNYPGAVWWGEGEDARLPDVWYPFEAAYCDGSKEIGWLYTDGTGQINGRWFFTDPKLIKAMGTGFSPNTNRVPDASRITPMPVRPPKRAGHDISVRVTIDTGGPGILDVKSELHDITFTERLLRNDDSPRRITLALADENEIPNRDFLLSWRQTDDTIEEAIFTHRPPEEDRYPDLPGAGFFTLMLQPPARVNDEDVRARELIFVLDCSGSMSDFPIEKAKDVMLLAIDTMRAGDTFNVITFNNTAETLWNAPRPNTHENRAAAKAYVDSRQGGGGTEMKKAVVAALQPILSDKAILTPAQLADLPADGRRATVAAPMIDILTDEGDYRYRLRVRDDLMIAMDMRTELPTVFQPRGVTVLLKGAWQTVNGRRVLAVDSARSRFGAKALPLRIVFFLTDGEVGNDDEIIESVRDHADTARVFTVGIGSSPNRHLLDEMARAGRGKSDYVSLQGDAHAAVDRFVRRVTTPVLTDVNIIFGDGLAVVDTIPPLDAMPDLFDEQPIILHGRYMKPGEGTLTITGNTGAGRWERTMNLTLPAEQPEHDVIATLWARTQVDELMRKNDIPGVIALGEEFQIVTQYTSFVAVEKSRLTIDGKPMLVSIPIEMPAGQSWQGTFGGPPDAERLAAQEYDNYVNKFGARKRALRAQVEQLRGEVWLTEERGEEIREIVNCALSDAAARATALGESQTPGYDAGFVIGDADGNLSLRLNGQFQSRFVYGERQGRDAGEWQALHWLDNPSLADIDGDGFDPRVTRYWRHLSSLERSKGLGAFGEAPELDLDSALRSQSTAGGRRPPGSGGAGGGGAPPAGGVSFRAADSPDDRRGGAGGGYGGGGAGRRGGGGGSIFGDPGADPQLGRALRERINPRGVYDVSAAVPDRVDVDLGPKLTMMSLDADERKERILDIIDAAIDENQQPIDGAALIEARFKGDELVIETTEDSEAARAAARRAEEIVQRLRPYLFEEVREGETLLDELGDAGGGPIGFRDSSENLTAIDHLQKTTVDLDIPDATLAQALGKLEQAIDLPISAHWQALEQIDTFPDDRISLRAAGLNAAEVIELVRSMMGDEFERPVAFIDGGVLRITRQDDLIDETTTVVYDVRDLLAASTGLPFEDRETNQPVFSADIVENLVNIVEELVDPEGWRDLGGTTGSLHELDGKLFIDNTLPNHRAIQTLLTQLRLALGLPTGDAFLKESKARQGSASAPEDRAVQQRLATSMVSFHEGPQALSDALHRLEEACGMVFHVDWRALENIGIDPPAKVFPGAEEQSVEDVLRRILEQAGDEFDRPQYSIRNGAIFVSSDEALRRRRAIITYDVHDLLEIGVQQGRFVDEAVQQIVNIIQENVDLEGWFDVGGDTGSLWEYAGFLIIHNTIENHRTIAILLAQIRLALDLQADEAFRAQAEARQRVTSSRSDRDALQRLTTARISLDGGAQPLAEVLHDLQQASGIAIEVDWFRLGLLGVSPTESVTLNVKDASVDRALDRILELVGDNLDHPEASIRDGRVVISSDNALRSETHLVVYDQRDLLRFLAERSASYESAVESVVEIIQNNVDPDGWRANGGDTGSLQHFAGLFIIDNTIDAHRDIKSVLDQVRLSLGLPVRSASADDAGAMADAEQIHLHRLAAHLQRVVDDRLLPFAVAQDLPEELDETYDGAKPEGAVWKDGGVLVSILMKNLQPESLDALTEAGLKIEARSESLPLVVGIAPLGRIGDLAFIEGVRRIEPTQASEERD